MNMKKIINSNLKILAVVLVSLTLCINGQAQKAKESGQLNIRSIELNYPIPAIPFYHFRAEIELPQ